MNDLLSWLAVVGIMMFVAAFVLVAIYFAQEVLTFFRLFRGRHVRLQVARRAAALERHGRQRRAG
jgi:uncharacterized membrane protein (DUF485 family)